MKAFARNNALSLAFFLLFLLAVAGQVYFGLKEYNQELADNGMLPANLGNYLSSGHFLQATFENWESEFLQMALFVVLTIFLIQKGSSESKDPDKKEEVDRKPDPKRTGAPWPVRRGGWVLVLYKHSLTIALLGLFAVSCCLHFSGSLRDENVQRVSKGKPALDASGYLLEPRFWFESFQNWQSEFLSVFAIVILSVYLRQIGSPQSKPVDAPNNETGE
ncbi:hypothetical protein OGH69_01645 [Flavobacterium sp. MFBS3-15]|uniref:DUF6766 family protein n=1 Tax=Flavobacterium sp. MFBS3-15 TaxID=2989816 RepID=UPI00223650FE|nr:DUF6766 family protein [Flavobacterium sp. MFBS3-15]MCW4467659.1 hypothetical protein [Flavobacterium sp. MFBS3-15]